MDAAVEKTSEQKVAKKRPKSGQEVIGQVRRGLLDAMYADGQQQRYLKRQVVENLLGVLSAARSSGFDWEEMAAICGQHGFEISPNTLKSYYIDLKEERGTNNVQKQAKVIIDEKKKIDVKRELKEGTADTLDARRRAHKRLASKPKLMDAAELREWEQKPPSTIGSLSTSSSPVQTKAPSASSPPKPRTPAPAPSASALEETPPKIPIRTVEPRPFEPLKPGQGKSIEQLEAEAESVEVATTVFEDLILHADGRVYYASGGPFLDKLSPRQVRLLKTSRRYMKSGSTDARSSSSVVKMSNKL